VSDREIGMVASHRFPTFRSSEDVDLDYLLWCCKRTKGVQLCLTSWCSAETSDQTGSVPQRGRPLPPLREQREIVGRFRNR